MKPGLSLPDQGGIFWPKGLSYPVSLVSSVSACRPHDHDMHLEPRDTAQGLHDMANTDLDGVHAVHAGSLEDGVVRLPGGVQHPIRQVFPAHEDAMQVALRAAVGDVAPVVVALDLPEPGEPVQDADLGVSR